MLVPEVEVRTIREADDAGVGMAAGVDVGVGVGVGVEFGVEFGVDTDMDVVEGVLVEGMEVLLELEIWPVVGEELREVEVVVSPPTIMLLKTLAIPPRGLSLEPVSAGDGLVVPEVVASFPPKKFPNPSLWTKRGSRASMKLII